MYNKFLTLLAVLAAGICLPAPETIAGEGPGTFTNPVLPFDYSDPDVIRTGDDYWLTASSFNCVPGLPILHSKDLVHWKIVNYALDRLIPEDRYGKPMHGNGVWAPCIRFHDGRYYIYWGDPDSGIYMVRAEDPAGEWSEPVLVKAGKGMIDPSPLWDDDGKAYIAHAWAASRIGLNSVISVFEMNAEGTACISDEVMVFDGNMTGNYTVEGPKFYKKDGYYYIFAPAGGVPVGWQLVMRSESVYGPYEARNVMDQGSTGINGPHQGGWVDTPSGEHWFMHFQEKQPFGRIVHLNPLVWDDEGWCVIGSDSDGDGKGEPVTEWKMPDTGSSVSPEDFRMQTADEFNGREPGLQWQWHANRQDWFGFGSGYGFFRLYGFNESHANLWDVPNLFLQKLPAGTFSATAKLTFCSRNDGDRAGLMVMGFDYAGVSVRSSGENAVVEFFSCTDAQKGNAEETVAAGQVPMALVKSGASHRYTAEIWLRMESDADGMCRFSYSTDGRKFNPAGEAFQAREGRWIGAKTGFFCTSSEKSRAWIDIDWFRTELD